MIRWSLVVLAAVTWGAGLVLVLTPDAPVEMRIAGVIAAGVGALLCMAGGLAFVRAGDRRDAAILTRTSAQAVQEAVRDITAPDRCCGGLDALCKRYGCPQDPSWAGDRR
jgi:hypothetical protein